MIQTLIVKTMHLVPTLSISALLIYKQQYLVHNYELTINYTMTTSLMIGTLYVIQYKLFGTGVNFILICVTNIKLGLCKYVWLSLCKIHSQGRREIRVNVNFLRTMVL